jgi:hypothetical protein
MKIKIEVSLEYGIMFLHDPYNDVDFPEDTGASPITFTDSCICFQVASYINSDAKVTLSSDPYDTSITPDISHRILTKSKFIGLTDVPVNYYGIIALKNEYADIKIWNYVENEQESSWIQIGNLDLF